MSRVNFGGESYKVRQREVDGKKQEIYYKGGEAFIKTSDGKLEKLNKTSDGVFQKASYNTEGYQKKAEENYANHLNSKYTDADRPTLEGKVDAEAFTHSADFVGYKGRFVDENDKGFNGIVFRDKESNENRVLAERNFENGSSQKNVYAMNPDSGKFFLESRTIQNADGGMTIRKFNYDTGEYDLIKAQAPQTE